MTDVEKDALRSCLAIAKNYLEFGSGDSTILALGMTAIQTVFSVDSSEQYVNERLKSNPVVADALKTGRLHFHIVDIGETAEWGFPKDHSKKALWPNYSRSVFRLKTDFDAVLIDGRFRVACTLNCLLHTPPNCAILIHDFWNRPQYHVVLKFLKTERQTGTLGVFRKKGDLDRERIRALVEKYQYLPGDRPLAFRIKEKLAGYFRKLQPSD